MAVREVKASTLATALVIKGVSIRRVQSGAASRHIERLGQGVRRAPAIAKLVGEFGQIRARSPWNAPFATHEVFNQRPPFEDVNLFTSDGP